MRLNKKEKSVIKKEIKEEAYGRYSEMMDSMVKKSYYQGFKSTLSTFLSLSMCAEATKNNLIKMGGDKDLIDSARATIIEEIWNLMDLYEKGIFQQLVQKHEQEKELEKEETGKR